MKSTSADLTQQYSAAMDSVSLIEALLTEPSLSQEEEDCLERNVRHLEIMIGKDLWPADQVAPSTAAIKAAIPRRAKA